MYYNLEHFVNFWRQTAEIWGVKLWIKWQHIQLIHLIFLLDVFSFGFFFDDLRGQIGLTLGPGTFEPQSPVCLTSVSTQYHAEATYTSSDLAQLEEVCCGTVRLLMQEHKHRYTMWTWSIRANRAQARLLPKAMWVQDSGGGGSNYRTGGPCYRCVNRHTLTVNHLRCSCVVFHSVCWVWNNQKSIKHPDL